MEILHEQAKYLDDVLDGMKKRINELTV